MKDATRENELNVARREGIRRGLKDIALGGMLAVLIALTVLLIFGAAAQAAVPDYSDVPQHVRDDILRACEENMSVVSSQQLVLHCFKTDIEAWRELNAIRGGSSQKPVANINSITTGDDLVIIDDYQIVIEEAIKPCVRLIADKVDERNGVSVDSAQELILNYMLNGEESNKAIRALVETRKANINLYNQGVDKLLSDCNKIQPPI